MSKKKKIRVDFRKNRAPRARAGDLTRRLQREGFEHVDLPSAERLTGKGELTRRRTVMADALDDDGAVRSDVDDPARLPGRVLSVHGLASQVEGPDGLVYQCATRRLLKTLSTDARHVVVAGDRVVFRPAVSRDGLREGMIERVEPRLGVLARTSRGRQHILVANLDQLLIITSAAEPVLKPNLVDRFLISAEQNRITPVICVNKVDLVDQAALQPLIGVYSQLGYEVLLTSAASGQGIDRLRRLVAGCESAVAGQSGVGKSSLLNAIEPGLGLRVSEVSRENQKGRHTTTTARLLPLAGGGHVVDTPGIRQFELWDVIAREVAGLYRDLRPFVSLCRYPDCTHTHEEACAVKDAVADGWLDARRYESYCHVLSGDAP